uniref:Uncharacterized protein n=1 Tax=Anguilla anguilla TaxID=7936 RepID=A0A0E9WWF6_ANGAN
MARASMASLMDSHSSSPDELRSPGPPLFPVNSLMLEGLLTPRSSQICVKISTVTSGWALKKCRTLLGCWMRFLAACSGEVKRLLRVPWKSLKLLEPSSSSYDWLGMMACCFDTQTLSFCPNRKLLFKWVMARSTA